MSRIYCDHMVSIEDHCDLCGHVEGRSAWREIAKDWAADIVKFTIAFTLARMLVLWMGWGL